MRKEINLTFTGPDGRTYQIIESNEGADSGIYYGLIKVSNWPSCGQPTTLQAAAIAAYTQHAKRHRGLRLV